MHETAAPRTHVASATNSRGNAVLTTTRAKLAHDMVMTGHALFSSWNAEFFGIANKLSDVVDCMQIFEVKHGNAMPTIRARLPSCWILNIATICSDYSLPNFFPPQKAIENYMFVSSRLFPHKVCKQRGEELQQTQGRQGSGIELENMHSTSSLTHGMAKACKIF